MKNWLIKKLGGYSYEEYQENEIKVAQGKLEFLNGLKRIRVSKDLASLDPQSLYDKAKFIDAICDELKLRRVYYPEDKIDAKR